MVYTYGHKYTTHTFPTPPPTPTGLKAFFTTPQLSTTDKVANSVALGTSPIVRALIDPEGGMRDVRALDNISFADWFRSHGGSQASIDRMWDPIGRWCGWCVVGGVWDPIGRWCGWCVVGGF